jgi:signal transduction histidine kinase
VRLSRKITLLLEVAILVLVAIYAYTEITDDARTTRADVESDLSAVAKESAALLVTLPPQTARDALQRSLDPSSAVKVRWLEPAEAGEVSDLAPGTERVQDTPKQLNVYRAFIDSAGARHILEVSRSTAEIDRLVRVDAIRSIVLIAVIIVFGTLYSMFIGTRIIEKPMSELVDSFRRVGKGDLHVVAREYRHDELGVLARELDQMIRELAEARESLVGAHTARLATVEQLQHAERLTTVGKLASGIAHELGTPLNVISGYARLIATGQETGDAAKDSAAIIDQQVQRITKIVRQLLDFARRSKPQLAATDLRGTVASAVGLAEMLAKKTGVRLDYVAPEQEMPVTIDDSKLQQVVLNVVNNAIQASPSGTEVSVRVTRASAKRPGATDAAPCIRVDISDRGAGIPEESLPRVFEPFFTTKPVGEGTGLGLSVSYGIVQEHGGWIAVESEVGKGSTFSVFLPAREDAA